MVRVGKKQGYLKGFQQTAMSDFYMIMFEAAQWNMPLDKNMAEHFFCYALSKILYNQVNEYMRVYPNKTKYEAMYWMLSCFDFSEMMSGTKKIILQLPVHLLY